MKSKLYWEKIVFPLLLNNTKVTISKTFFDLKFPRFYFVSLRLEIPKNQHERIISKQKEPYFIRLFYRECSDHPQSFIKEK